VVPVKVVKVIQQGSDEERQVAGKPIMALGAMIKRRVPESWHAKRRAGIQGRKGLFLIPA
jgi:hypothetical protein